MSTTQVSWNGSRLIPAPYCEINKEFQRTSDGEIIGSLFNITLTGKIMSYRGSPDSSGNFFTGSDYPSDETIGIAGRLSSLLRKEEAIRKLFSADGGTLVIQGQDGAMPLKANPRIGTINFASGPWVEYVDYSISLQADKVYGLIDDVNVSGLISDASETWNIETEETPEGLNLPRTYRLSHSISAVGKRFYDVNGNLVQEPWKNAREYVFPKLGFDSSFLFSSGVQDLSLNASQYHNYNHVRTENIDKKAGGYSVTESWILTSGTALEDFSVESINNIDTALVGVTIQGNITGMELRNSDMSLNTTKYNNALTKFTQVSGLALGRAQAFSGYTLNITPLQQTIGRNPITGTINYSFNYDNRPSNLLGGRTEHISVHDDLDQDVIAIIPILGRTAGPLAQPINTKREKYRSLTIDATFERPTFGSGSVSDIRYAFYGQRPSLTLISGVIQAVDPALCGFSTSYRIEDGENYDPYQGRYSRNIKWFLQ